jgi:diguanylate cyclase (GGDEF)-like protein
MWNKGQGGNKGKSKSGSKRKNHSAKRDILKVVFLVDDSARRRLIEPLKEVTGVSVSSVLNISKLKKNQFQLVEKIKGLLEREKPDFLIDLTVQQDLTKLDGLIESSTVRVITGLTSSFLNLLLTELSESLAQRHVFNKLEAAYQKYQKELEESRDKITKANIELENRLAEIFFTHEFFKALTTHISVDEVASLISDGANGILGAEISCVYLLDGEKKVLFLRGYQGRNKNAFRRSIKVGESIIGRAVFQKGPIVDHEPSQADTFLIDGRRIKSQSAVSLRMQDKVLGVLGIAMAGERVLSSQEQERFQNIANMGSLALQNALFHEELEWLSVTDRLTELYNYGFFQRRLSEEIHRAQRCGEPLALLMIDIDYFKEYNDVFGHPKGDLVLKKIAVILRENTRDIDTLVRYGGEEFAVILPATDKPQALTVAERIRRTVATTEFDGNKEIPKVNKTISIGLAGYPVDAKTPEELVEEADRALYAAKRKGRNRVEVA